jgi:hypothetical protein
MRKKYLLLFLALGVVGCGSIPQQSSIKEGANLGAVSVGSIVRVIASSPEPGMTPEEIVSGFLNASASSDNDFKIAREYLTPELQNIWQPTKEINVYEGQGRLNTLQENTVIFSAPLYSTIDSKSRLTLSEPDAELIQEFSLIQVNNEWRINLKNDNLLISKVDLNRSFTTYPLWFPDNSLKTLVPDHVVLPRSMTGNATRLMQLLLGGPGENLMGGVNSAFPIGTTLAINSVPVTSGLATVSLNEAALSAEPFMRELISAQIVKTLSSIPEISAVRINVGSQPLNVPNTPIRQNISLWDKFSPDFGRTNDSLAIAEGKIVRLTADSIEPITIPYFSTENWFAAVENREKNILAGVNVDRTRLVVENTNPTGVKRSTVSGQGLRAPRTDIYGAVWVTGINQVSVIQNNKLLNVSISEIDKQNVIDVIPSPDGVRVAIILNTVYGSELRLGTIVRDEQSININFLRKVVRDGFSVNNATWQDEVTLLYLDKSEDPASINAVDTFTGLSKTLYTQSGAVNLAGVTKKPLFLTLITDTLIERVSGNWVERGKFINASYPG